MRLSGFSRAATILVLAGSLAAGACSDGPTGPGRTEETGGEPSLPWSGQPASAFSIDIRYVKPVTATQRSAVEAAAERWRAVILGDLPGVQAIAPAGTCFEGQPALNEVVDDILIFVEFVDMDGPGKVLGEAGPCFVRRDTQLPLIGQLRLDNADLERMELAGSLNDVIMHEMGHIIGFGTIWSRWSLVSGSGGSDPYFTGEHAVSEYRALGGTQAGVPVENTGSTGTRDSHWRESVFGSELMTGYIGGTPNPLSDMTVASLRDLGYNVGSAAAAAALYDASESVQRVLQEPLDMDERERIVKPRFEVDAGGRRSPMAVQAP